MIFLFIFFIFLCLCVSVSCVANDSGFVYVCPPVCMCMFVCVGGYLVFFHF